MYHPHSSLLDAGIRGWSSSPRLSPGPRQLHCFPSPAQRMPLPAPPPSSRPAPPLPRPSPGSRPPEEQRGTPCLRLCPTAQPYSPTASTYSVTMILISPVLSYKVACCSARLLESKCGASSVPRHLRGRWVSASGPVASSWPPVTTGALGDKLQAGAAGASRGRHARRRRPAPHPSGPVFRSQWRPCQQRRAPLCGLKTERPARSELQTWHSSNSRKRRLTFAGGP